MGYTGESSIPRAADGISRLPGRMPTRSAAASRYPAWEESGMAPGSRACVHGIARYCVPRRRISRSRAAADAGLLAELGRTWQNPLTRQKQRRGTVGRAGALSGRPSRKQFMSGSPDESIARVSPFAVDHFLNTMPEAMVVVGHDGAIVRTNERLWRVFGYDQVGDLRGQPVEALIPERLRSEHALFRRAYQ